MKNGRSKQKLTLVSDNPVYQPYQIDANDVLEIWQAQMVITWANQQQRWDVDQLASIVSNLHDQVNSPEEKNELAGLPLSKSVVFSTMG